MNRDSSTGKIKKDLIAKAFLAASSVSISELMGYDAKTPQFRILNESIFRQPSSSK